MPRSTTLTTSTKRTARLVLARDGAPDPSIAIQGSPRWTGFHDGVIGITPSTDDLRDATFTPVAEGTTTGTAEVDVTHPDFPDVQTLSCPFEVTVTRATGGVLTVDIEFGEPTPIE